MDHSSLLAWRIALLSSLGIVSCSGEDAEAPQYRIGGTEREVVACGPRMDFVLTVPADSMVGNTFDCQTDYDCTVDGQGYCRLATQGSVCTYNLCAVDADCDANQICECNPAGGQCKAVNCLDSTECATGAICLKTLLPQLQCNSDGSASLVSQAEYHCQTLDDECAVDNHCNLRNSEHCVFRTSRHVCEAFPAPAFGSCGIPGRPFLVKGQQRIADLLIKPAIVESTAGDSPLAEGDRRVLAEYWTQVALAEHASIAAFARFTLQLLHLGAPCALVEGAIAAQRDEAWHTQLALELAGKHGADLQLGPLSITDALAETDLASIVVNTIREGCIGETVAALEAGVAADRAVDPKARAALSRIVVDEKRHAELAWRFVHWAIERDPSLLAVVMRVIHEEATPQCAVDGEIERPQLQAHGFVSPRERAQLKALALRLFVEPVAQAMCA